MSAFLDADYSAIEARIVCWLAGQEDALEEYRQGVDRYKRMASFIYGVPEEQVNKHPQRFVGKQAILLCGFQGGPPKFRDTCLKMGGYDLPAGMEDKAVGAWRAKHKKVVQSWVDVNNAAKNAIIKPGSVFKVARCEFFLKHVEGMDFLLIRLPSGRKLAYPRPKIIPGKFENSTQVSFYGHILGTKWGTVTTYGGKILQNITEGVQSDIMANGAHNCERAGYETATLIHDECLSYYHPERGQSVEEFVGHLTRLPAWADGLPIAAEGELVSFYKK